MKISLLLVLAFLAHDHRPVGATHDSLAQDLTAQKPAPATGAPPVSGASFEWVAAHDHAGNTTLSIAWPERYVLHIRQDHTLGVRADCNWRLATFDPIQGALNLGPMLGSPAICNGASLGGRFMALLADTAAIEHRADGSLVLRLRAGGGLLFRPLRILP